MTTMSTIKRNGDIEPLDTSKINRAVEWAVGDTPNTSASEIIAEAHLQFRDRITTEEIQETLIKTASNLITVETPNYQWVAAKLKIQDVYKKVFNSLTPRNFAKAFESLCQQGIYDIELLEKYSMAELEIASQAIDHTRDLNFTYAGIVQVVDKYAIRDERTDTLYETPQELFMALSLAAFSISKKETRMKHILQCYDLLSTQSISLPTPMMLNLRSPLKNYASCVTLTVDDSLKSWAETSSAVLHLSASDNGIGLDVSKIATIGTPVRAGRVIHTGIIPVLSLFEKTIQSCTQTARGASATVHIPWWNYEIENVVQLKGVRLAVNKRVSGLDYSVLLNQLLFERIMADGTITLFSPRDVPEVLKTFYTKNPVQFAKAYAKAENDPTITLKRVIRARSLFNLIITERHETGRIYLMFIDEVNRNSTFNVPIVQSNLCQEITLPSTPLQKPEITWVDKDEVGVCILANINMKVDVEELPAITDLLVRLLDNAITMQQMSIPAANRGKNDRRSLGIGINNYAYWLANQDLTYGSPEALAKTHTWMEHFQYNLISASVLMAQEEIPCLKYSETTYSQGVLPIDRYNKNVDELVDPTYVCDWEALRERMKKYGIRHSCLSAIPPSESSSIVTNATSGVELPRAPITIKSGKVSALPQVVPDIVELKDKYCYLFDKEEYLLGYLKTIAVMQKFICQSISTNTFNKYSTDAITVSRLLEPVIFAQNYGIKTLYYEVNETSAGDVDDAVNGCNSGSCSV